MLTHICLSHLSDRLCQPCAGYHHHQQHHRPRARRRRGVGRRRHRADAAGAAAPTAAPSPYGHHAHRPHQPTSICLSACVAVVQPPTPWIAAKYIPTSTPREHQATHPPPHTPPTSPPSPPARPLRLPRPGAPPDHPFACAWQDFYRRVFTPRSFPRRA